MAAPTWRERLRKGVSDMMGGGLMSAAERKTRQATDGQAAPKAAPPAGKQWGEPAEMSDQQKEGLRRLRDQYRQGAKPPMASRMVGLRRKMG